MFLLSTKPLQKLTGTDRQAGGRADKPVYWEAAPPKILKMFLVRDPSVQSITVFFKDPLHYNSNLWEFYENYLFCAKIKWTI